MLLWKYLVIWLKLHKTKGSFCAHWVKVAHGTPDTGMERDMRHLLQIGLLDPAVTIINSITSCQQFIDGMVRLPDSLISTLHANLEGRWGLFSTEVTSESPWTTTNAAPEAPPSAPDALPSATDVSLSLDYPMDTQPHQDQGPLNLHHKSVHLSLTWIAPTPSSDQVLPYPPQGRHLGLVLQHLPHSHRLSKVPSISTWNLPTQPRLVNN